MPGREVSLGSATGFRRKLAHVRFVIPNDKVIGFAGIYRHPVGTILGVHFCLRVLPISKDYSATNVPGPFTTLVCHLDECELSGASNVYIRTDLESQTPTLSELLRVVDDVEY